ncbi:MAG: cell division protein FtsZ [Dehalococcoidales bacterium]
MARSSYVSSGARIKVIGTGGAGSNAVSRMVREHLHGVEFIAMNTDAQALETTEATQRVQLGPKTTRGLGAGGDHIIGHKAAEESRDAIAEVVAGADMVFLTAGMGGGTGTGSASIVAELAKKTGALTIAVVTKPFTFEGTHRAKTAEEGINALKDSVDTLIIIPNDRLLELCNQGTSIDGAFRMADEVLLHGVQAIAEVITVPGLINLDFADVRTIMKDAGPAWMSIGRGTGQNRAVEAARQALASPLLDISMAGARGVLFNIAGGSLTLNEVSKAAEVIRQAVDPQANVIFGVVLEPEMGNDVRLTLIATGFNGKGEKVDLVKEKEIEGILKNINDDELDMPSYTRQEQVNQSGKVALGKKK